jgi:hypothetical protein
MVKAKGNTSKFFRKHASNLNEIKVLKKTAILGIAYVLRRVMLSNDE